MCFMTVSDSDREKSGMAPKRVLHVLGGTSLGGAESRIMDLYRQMDRNRIQFDFLVHSDEQPRKPQYFDEEIKKLGGNIYVLPKMKLYNYRAYRQAIADFFREHHEFAAVHGHMTSTAAIYLPIAKKYGIPRTIAHARSAGVDKGLKGLATRMMRCGLADKAEDCFACSKEAAVSVFGQKAYDAGRVTIIPNAINPDRFAFHEELRRSIRSRLNLGEKFVVGHVGRFHYSKNHEYLIRVFAAFQERYEKQSGKGAVLLLLGEGALMEQAKELCRTLAIEQNVIFAGNCGNVEEYYNAMDLFCFPSRFEGLPGTVVEAQANGLPCIISDRITREVGVTELVCYESIDKAPEVWAEIMMEKAVHMGERKSRMEEIADAGFDVRRQAEKLQAYYLESAC